MKKVQEEDDWYALERDRAIGRDELREIIELERLLWSLFGGLFVLDVICYFQLQFRFGNKDFFHKSILLPA